MRGLHIGRMRVVVFLLREFGTDRPSYRVVFFSWSPPIFLSTRFHVNCSVIYPSARGYKGILYLENLKGDQLKKHTLYIRIKVI